MRCTIQTAGGSFSHRRVVLPRGRLARPRGSGLCPPWLWATEGARGARSKPPVGASPIGAPSSLGAAWQASEGVGTASGQVGERFSEPALPERSPLDPWRVHDGASGKGFMGDTRPSDAGHRKGGLPLAPFRVRHGRALRTQGTARRVASPLPTVSRHHLRPWESHPGVVLGRAQARAPLPDGRCGDRREEATGQPTQ